MSASFSVLLIGVRMKIVFGFLLGLAERGVRAPLEPLSVIGLLMSSGAADAGAVLAPPSIEEEEGCGW